VSIFKEIFLPENNPLYSVPKKKLLVRVMAVLSLLFVLKVIFSMWTDSYAGILSLLITFIMTTVLMKQRGIAWSDLGFKKPESFKKTILIFILMVIDLLATALLSVYIAKKFFVKPDEATRFIGLEGNLLLTLWWVLVGWVVGGFIEELMYRAFLISAIQRILGDNWYATLFAIVIPGFIWAARHVYFKGAYGAVFMFFSSIVFGIFYIMSKRNLWPNIFLHGLINTFGFVGRY